MIRRILKHDFYHTGIYKITWDGETYEIHVPPIVDPDTGRRVQERFANYKAYPAGNLKAHALAAGVIYCKACGVRMGVQAISSHGRKYPYYRCYSCGRDTCAPGCAHCVRMERIDTELWDKLWALISEPIEFERKLRAKIEELKVKDVDIGAECEKLEQRLDDLVPERQRVYTWARKGQINEEDMVQQLAAIGIEESGIQRELSEKRLLVGNRAEQLIELAQDYRERVKNGIEGLNGKPQNEEEARLQFTFRRKLVEGIVKRVDVLSDKTITVQVELDLNDPATDLFTRDALPH